MAAPVAVDWRIAALLSALAAALAADRLAVGVEPRVLGVDVEGQYVEVAVQREDLPLEQARHRVAHASTPPLARASPSVKCGHSLLSNMLRAEPMAMCMSRYL